MQCDLSLVSLDDLLMEVDKRFDHWIFCGQQLGIGGPDHVFSMRKWRGGSAACAGLASQMQIAIYDAFQEQQKNGSPP